MLNTYTKADLHEIYALAYAHATTTKNRHNKIAYAFALKLVNSLDENATLTIRQTKNAVNIGDLGECVVKYHMNKDADLHYSLAGTNDLDRKALNEIKTFSSANRYPNGLEKPSPFIAVAPQGVYHITKQLVEKYWEEFKIDSNGLKTPTTAILKSMIEDGAKKLKTLSSKIGL